MVSAYSDKEVVWPCGSSPRSDCVAAPLGQIVYTDPRKLRSLRRIFLMIEVRHSYESLDKKNRSYIPLYTSILRLILENYNLPARFPHDGGESLIIVKKIHIAFPRENLCLT